MRGNLLNLNIKAFIKQSSDLTGKCFEIPHYAYSKRYELFEKRQNGVSQPLYGKTTMNRKRHIENQILVTGEKVDLNTPENKVRH